MNRFIINRRLVSLYKQSFSQQKVKSPVDLERFKVEFPENYNPANNLYEELDYQYRIDADEVNVRVLNVLNEFDKVIIN